MHDKTAGARFSLNYIERPKALRDSPRARRRLLQLFYSCRNSNHEYGGPIQAETGCKLEYIGYGYDWEGFFVEGHLRDILDSITVLTPLLKQNYAEKKWLSEVERIFREENLEYTVDSLGGVHFSVDKEFARNWSATLAGLGLARYEGAQHSFKSVQEALDGQPPNTRDAIRHCFEAVEIVFRLLLGSKVSRLGASEVKRELRQVVTPLFSGTAKDSVGRQLESFAEWVNSAHPYRHGQEVEQPDMPPTALAILVVSTGASYLRWLIEIDQEAQNDR